MSGGVTYAVEYETNLALIVVESMVPRVNLEMNKLFSGFNSPKITKKYEVLEGVVGARGLIIYGEIRELCGGRLSHRLFGGKDKGRIPSMMRHAGYQTTAIHVNYGKMYGRDEWDPKIGFVHYISANSYGLPVDSVDDRWGSTLDTSLIEWRGSKREQLGKNFEYALTVSTHLSVLTLPGANL